MIGCVLYQRKIAVYNVDIQNNIKKLFDVILLDEQSKYIINVFK